jgi:hypothetical protein
MDRWLAFGLQKITWNSWFRLPAGLSGTDAAILNVILLFLASGLGGLIIFAFCRYYYRGVPISHQLDASLIPAAVISTLIFYQAGTWPALSILMVATLAIVHFRTVIKDMTDVIFVFWAVLSGIFTGAGFPLPTLVLDAAIALISLILISRRSFRLIYLLIIAGQLIPALQPLHGKIRSQFEKNGLIDLTIEVRLRFISLEIVDRIAAMDGVQNAVMVSNDGNPSF